MRAHLALLFGVSLTSLACGGGTPAEVVRPDDKKGADALGESSGQAANCTKVPDKGEPLIVDWKTTEQLDLTVAMQKGVAVVAYDCKSIKVIKDCKVSGKYSFTAIPSVLQETVQINDADEARASLPLGGATLGGEISRGSSIDIALAYVGKRSALSDLITKSDLGAECSGATHFVRAATIGAFAMETGTKGKVRAAAEIFGAGASAGSSSDKKRLNSAGDVSACKSVKDGADKPPESCSAIIRLELVAIADSAAKAGDPPKETKAPTALANTCPDGFVPSGGRCAKKTATTAHRCDPENVEECKEQCKKGDLESCYNAGAYLQDRARGFPPDDLFAPYLEKACNGGIGRACGRAALFFAPGLHACCTEDKHFTFAEKGCGLLDRGSCMWVAEGDKRKTWPERVTAAKKACSLGLGRACEFAAGLLLEGRGADLAKNNKEAIQLLDDSCGGGNANACISLIDLYSTDKKHVYFFAAKKSDVPPDEKRADEYAKKVCLLKKGGPSGTMPSDVRGRKCQEVAR